MRSLLSAVTLTVAALALGGCGRSNPPPKTAMVTVPDSFVRPSTGRAATLAPVARGTIRLGEVETPGAPPPTAVGGGPPSATTGAGADNAPPVAHTSVGPMSPTTVTGADSPLDSATTAGPHAGQPGNPTMTGSATAPGGPNTHGGTPGPAGR